MLAAVGKDKHGRQIIILWDTSNVLTTGWFCLFDLLIFKGKPPIVLQHASGYHINKIIFVPFEETKFVTCGRDNIRLWRIKGGILRGCSVECESNIKFEKQDYRDIAFETSILVCFFPYKAKNLVSSRSAIICMFCRRNNYSN